MLGINLMKNERRGVHQVEERGGFDERWMSLCVGWREGCEMCSCWEGNLVENMMVYLEGGTR